MREAEFRHPRLVAVYDAECPWSREEEVVIARPGALGVIDRHQSGVAELGFSHAG